MGSIISAFGVTNPHVQYQRLPYADVNLTGKHILVVGGTDGLGRGIVRAALNKGADVIVVGRTFRDQEDPHIRFIRKDLSLMKEAAELVHEIPVEDLHSIIFTTGILASSTRAETSEGIEKDMAISALSRAVMMKEMAPRIQPNTRIYIMGAPGNGQSAMIDDLNSEHTPYRPMATHMNTVGANEGLVLHWANELAPRHIPVYGLNPGLIKTGIRGSIHGGGFIGRIIESIIDVFSITADQYGEYVIPLLVAPDLQDHSGTMFSQRGHPILPTAVFNEPTYTPRLMKGIDGLIQRALETYTKK